MQINADPQILIKLQFEEINKLKRENLILTAKLLEIDNTRNGGVQDENRDSK
jgi:hypothetical protein